MRPRVHDDPELPRPWYLDMQEEGNKIIKEEVAKYLADTRRDAAPGWRRTTPRAV